MAKQKYQVTVPEIAPLTEELVYWLGFILADGCVLHMPPNKGQNKLRINLKPGDADHLRKLVRFLDSNHPVYIYEASCQLSISSNALVAFFESFGIVPRKSLIAVADDRLVNSRHFWRGIVDGDGSIGRGGRNKNLPRFQFSGTKKLCQQFLASTNRNCNNVFRNVSIKECNNLWHIQTMGSNAAQVIDWLYHDNIVALQRKQQLAGVV